MFSVVNVGRGTLPQKRANVHYWGGPSFRLLPNDSSPTPGTGHSLPNVNPGSINPRFINMGVSPFSGWIQKTFGGSTPIMGRVEQILGQPYQQDNKKSKNGSFQAIPKTGSFPTIIPCLSQQGKKQTKNTTPRPAADGAWVLRRCTKPRLPLRYGAFSRPPSLARHARSRGGSAGSLCVPVVVCPVGGFLGGFLGDPQFPSFGAPKVAVSREPASKLIKLHIHLAV